MTSGSLQGRVRPPADLERFVVDPLHEAGLFPTKARALTFAGLLGFSVGSPKALGRAGEGIRVEYFASAGDDQLIDAVAVAATGDLSVMREDSDKIRIELFEQYIVAGLELMREECFGPGRTMLSGLLALIDRCELPDQETGELPGLDDFA